MGNLRATSPSPPKLVDADPTADPIDLEVEDRVKSLDCETERLRMHLRRMQEGRAASARATDGIRIGGGPKGLNGVENG